jgi:type I restriction enzyme S subunit
MKSSATHFLPGDVLYGRLRPYLNKVVQPDFEGLASAEFIPLTPAQGIQADFIRLRINAADFVAYASRLDEGDRPRVDWDGIRRFQILLPPSAEQERITEAVDSLLSRIDAALASLGRAQARLKAYRASVLKAAVEGRIVPTEAELARKEARSYEPAEGLLARMLKARRLHWEETELARMKAVGRMPKDDKWKAKYKEPAAPGTMKLPQLPEGWCWASVDQVGDVLLGRQRAPQYLTGRRSRPYLRVANIKDDRIELADIEEMDFDKTHFEKYRLQPGDILVSEGQSPHLVGQSAIYRGGVGGLCFQKTLHRFRSTGHGPCAEFAQIVFRAHVRMRVFQEVASITTNIAHLTLVKFKQSRFPLPPAPEQERIWA